MPPGMKRQRTARHAAPGPTKRLKPEDAPHLFVREDSPSKNVHFKRTLTQGPTVIDPARRSQSPTRSALRKPEPENSDDDEAGSPDIQYLREQEAREEEMKARKAVLAKARSHAKQAPKPKPKRVVEDKYAALREAYMDSTIAGNLKTSGNIHSLFCDQLNNLKQKVQDFCVLFKSNPRSGNEDVLRTLLKPGNEQMVRYIGCLALGGKRGEDSWRQLLSDQGCIQALAFGIIGRALKEHVFGALYFGGDDDLVTALSKQEMELEHLDGFFRTKRRADTIRKHEAKHNSIATFQEAVSKLALQLERLLLPLWTLGSTSTAWESSNKRGDLTGLVAFAAKLSHYIRRDADTVYYWPPTFKDEEFEPSRMECLNLYDMIQASPYDKKTINGIDRAILKEGSEHESEAIVQVVAFPGLVAYQQGGGDLAKEELAKETQREGSVPKDVQVHRRIAMQSGKGELTGEEGFRTTVLGKSLVVLQWGNQRLLTKEAGTSAHIDAMKSGNAKKYDDDYDGVVELHDLFLDCNSEVLTETTQSQQPSPQRSASWSWKPWRGRDPSPSGVSVDVEELSLEKPRKGSKASRKASR